MTTTKKDTKEEFCAPCAVPALAAAAAAVGTGATASLTPKAKQIGVLMILIGVGLCCAWVIKKKKERRF